MQLWVSKATTARYKQIMSTVPHNLLFSMFICDISINPNNIYPYFRFIYLAKKFLSMLVEINLFIEKI